MHWEKKACIGFPLHLKVRALVLCRASESPAWVCVQYMCLRRFLNFVQIPLQLNSAPVHFHAILHFRDYENGSAWVCSLANYLKSFELIRIMFAEESKKQENLGTYRNFKASENRLKSFEIVRNREPVLVSISKSLNLLLTDKLSIDCFYRSFRPFS